MATTKQNLRDWLRLELKIDPNGRIWSNAILDRNLEKARTKVQSDGNHDWSFNDGENTENSVAFQALYDLPEDFVRIEEGQVRYNYQAVQPVNYAELKAIHANLNYFGRPNNYYLRGASIGFFYVPNEVKQIDYCYRRRLPFLVNDTDETGMPTEFDEAVLQYASYLCWGDIQGREDKANQAIQNYLEAIGTLYQQFLNRNDANLSFKFATI